MGLYKLLYTNYFLKHINNVYLQHLFVHMFSFLNCLFVYFIDKDECAGSNNCQQKCIDGVGTYTCGCNTGYRLNTTDLISCLRKSTSIFNRYLDSVINQNC